jgi:hypothetical protein
MKPVSVDKRAGTKPRLTMEETTALAAAAARRHIIKRPRLTRLLDETEARIILLVAPAGYGKTTLAREWLRGRDGVAWFSAMPACADGIALAEGITASFAQLVPNVQRRIAERIKATPAPTEHDLRVLAEMLVEETRGYTDLRWLVIDDYHATAVDGDESFARALVELAPAFRILLAARSRPTWATPRRLLYGEIAEIGQNQLTMDDGEARAVLGSRPERELRGLLALAQGWPALLRLAASTDQVSAPEHAASTPLYDFFADELLTALPNRMAVALHYLAIPPRVTLDLARLLLGDEGEIVLREAMSLGLLAPSASDHSTLSLHPLFRGFLAERISRNGQEWRIAIRRTGHYFLDQGKYDDVFATADEFDDSSLFEALVSRAMTDMLKTSRTATLKRWVEWAHARRIDLPELRVIEAELAYRRGDHARARAVTELSLAMEMGQKVRFARLIIAARAARLANDEQSAYEFARRARGEAEDRSARWDALWLEFLALSELQSPKARDSLRELHHNVTSRADEQIQLLTAECIAATSSGSNLEEHVAAGRTALALLDDVEGPLVRVSFLNTLATLTVLLGRYAEARELSTRLRADVALYRLDFVDPYVKILEADIAGVSATFDVPTISPQALRLIFVTRPTYGCSSKPYPRASGSRLRCVRQRTRSPWPRSSNRLERYRACTQKRLQ